MDTPDTWNDLLQLARRCENGEEVSAEAREHALRSAMNLGCRSLPHTAACSVTQEQGGGQFVTLISSEGALATALDRVQYGAGDGPCISAARHQRVEQIHAMSQDERWAELSQQALEHSVQSSLSVPLPGAHIPRSALNFYGSVVEAYSPARAQALASLVARTVAVLLAEGPGQFGNLSPSRVQELVSSRSLIARAQGMIMEREGADATTAYHVLATRSAEQRSTLADVARGVVTNGPAFSDQDVSA
jgi:hypothetical protein